MKHLNRLFFPGFLSVLLAVVFSGCAGEQAAVLPADSLFRVVADSSTVTWPVGIDVSVDDELLHRYRILLTFKTVKDAFGRDQYLYARHTTELLYASEDVPGFTFPALHVSNAFVDRGTDNSDSTRCWETELDFVVYFSDAAIRRTTERFHGGPHGLLTSYTDRIDLSSRASGRNVEKEVFVANAFSSGKNAWSLPAIGDSASREIDGFGGARTIAVKIYAQPYH